MANPQLGLFKERGLALTSAKELDAGDVEPVTPQDAEGVDYSKNATAREELLTGVGLFLADDYTTLKIKNNNLVKLFNLLKKNKLTFTKISNDSAKYPKESKLVEKVFKTSFTIEQAEQADEIIQQRVFKIPALEKQLNDLLQMQKKKKVSFEEPQVQKRKGEPDFKSHDEKRKRGSMKPRQTEEEEKQKSSEMKEPSRMREILRSIPIIGGFLANIFTPEKAEGKISKDGENVKKVSSTFEIESRDQKRTSGLEHTLQEAEQKSSEMKKTSGIREFLRSIPIVGRFLANIFTPEKIEIISNPIYTSKGVGDQDSQQDKTIVHFDKADDITITEKDNKDVKKLSGEIKEGSITKVDSKKDHEPGGPG